MEQKHFTGGQKSFGGVYPPAHPARKSDLKITFTFFKSNAE